MKKRNIVFIVVGVIIVLLIVFVIMYLKGTFYYMNEKKHINLKEVEKKVINASPIILDYDIQDDTIYYYSMFNYRFSKTANIYKSDLDGKNLKRVCSLKMNNYSDLGFVYNNKMYYRADHLEERGLDGSHDNSYSATIASIDLDNCKEKGIFSYTYRGYDLSSFNRDENNLLHFTYSENPEMASTRKELIYDMAKETTISLEKKELKYNSYKSGMIFSDNKIVYDLGKETTIHILDYNDNYLYFYTEYEKEDYIYKLDLNNKVIVNKEMIPVKEKFPRYTIEKYNDGYFFIDKKLYKYNYDNDKLEVVLNEISEDTQHCELHIINNNYIFTFIDDSITFADEERLYYSRIFIYNSDGKIVFKENQNKYTNTFRNAIIDGKKLYVVYSDGKVKTLDLSK